MARAGCVHALVVVAALTAASAGATDRWQVAERNDDEREGYVLYVSESEHAGKLRYKIETRLEATPKDAVAGILLAMTSPRFIPERQRREILAESPEEILVYTYIDMPMIVSDREVALRIYRSTDENTGSQRIYWETANEALEAPAKNVVRIPSVEGYWEFEPDGPGRSRATYVTYSDVGGSLPAWMIEPMMRDQITGDVQRLRDVIQTLPREVSAEPPRLPAGG